MFEVEYEERCSTMQREGVDVSECTVLSMLRQLRGGRKMSGLGEVLLPFSRCRSCKMTEMVSGHAV